MQSYQHFTLEERISLSQMLQNHQSMRKIATALNRNVSSISREIRRNQNKDKSYHPWRATVLYICRRKKCRRRYRLADADTLVFVKAGLNKYWSPEIISQRWKMEHPDKPLGHTTIYRALKRKQIEGCKPTTHLRRHGKRKNHSLTQSIHPTHFIHERPEIAATRGRLGDIEGDTVYGAIGKGCVVTAVDRKSRMLYASLCWSRDSSLIVKAFGKALGEISVCSLTLDRGSEFAKFSEIEQNHSTTVYFADPHSPWQRPSNENINGLLRFFYPKGTDFTAVSEEDFQNVLLLINSRPRKCLGWLSPIEFISHKCCS